MVEDEVQLLTHSRQDCFKTCRKKHWFSYELGIRSEVDAKALRMGSAFHEGLEKLAPGTVDSLGDACGVVHGMYEACPERIPRLEWDYERETILRLLCGYHWHWGDQLNVVEAEKPFNLPLVNPKTEKSSRTFRRAGKIDGIARLEDGRFVVRECKLLAEDISSDSPLWRRLLVDHQVSNYVNAARDMGYEVESVLYDVTRKPTIKPSAVPVLDELGAKIVLDRHGTRVMTDRGLFRQTGDKARGYVLQTRDMTADEWGEKLITDITERPEFYFVRREIARLDQDLDEYRRELWDIAQNIRTAQKENQHYRTCNKNTCAWCEYFGLCTSGIDPTEYTPEGFVRLSDPHPELGEACHGPS